MPNQLTPKSHSHHVGDSGAAEKSQSNFPPSTLPSTLGVAPRHELSMALRRAYMRLHRDTCAHCASQNISADQYVLMNVVKSASDLKQSELVVLLDSDANTLSAMLRRLQIRGLIQRDRHPDDSRAKSVRLTESGVKLLESVEQKTVKNRQEMENVFTPDELRQLISLLRRLATYEVE